MESNTFQYLSPASLIRAAKAAHPAFKYAIVVAGLAAIVTIVLRFGASPATLIFGSVIVVVLMVLFFVFAQAVAVTKSNLALPAIVLIWSFLLLAIATATLLFTSAFFDFPLPLKSIIVGNNNLSSISQRTLSRSEPDAVSTNANTIANLSNTVRIRIALIIGNNNYSAIQSLKNPINDAKAIKEMLESKGFQTIYCINANRDEIATAIEKFKVILSLGGIGIVYYSGHGAHLGDSDYMIPVDVPKDIKASNFSQYAVNVTDILRPVDKIISNTPDSSGNVIMYATASGDVAQDGQDGNSPFAHALLTALDQKDLDIIDAFRLIAMETKKHSNNKQMPWLSSSFSKHFYFNNRDYDMKLGILKILFFDTCRTNPFEKK